jgi:hypothetical protein
VVVYAGNLKATVLACPIDLPRMVRFVYDVPAKEFRAEFDLGLSAAPQKFPSRADAAIVQYEVPAKWAFRRALAKYHELYANAFARRAGDGGIWLPFSEIASIEKPADFGFAFHEIDEHQVNPHVLEDDAKLGVGSFVYTEPQSYWQEYKGQGKGTYESRVTQLRQEAGNRAGAAILTSSIIRVNGQHDIYLQGAPYTPAVPWGLDANPLIPSGRGQFELDRLARALATPGIDGVYVDSMEGWGQLCDYAKEHWRFTQFPLTFDPANENKVALLNFWGTYSFVREISTRVHSNGLLLFGNDAFFRRWQLAPWVDVAGREYTWIQGDNFTPVPDERYFFLRAMAGRKPYLMLMNNRFDRGELMERFFQRNLMYGVFPSMYFGHQSASDEYYWGVPARYNRDRALFKKYIPLIRKLDKAGWEPVPQADVEPATIRVERWGNEYFTVHNTSASDAHVKLIVNRHELKLNPNISATEELTAKPVASATGEVTTTLEFDLPADGYGMISLQRAK